MVPHRNILQHHCSHGRHTRLLNGDALLLLFLVMMVFAGPSWTAALCGEEEEKDGITPSQTSPETRMVLNKAKSLYRRAEYAASLEVVEEALAEAGAALIPGKGDLPPSLWNDSRKPDFKIAPRDVWELRMNGCSTLLELQRIDEIEVLLHWCIEAGRVIFGPGSLEEARALFYRSSYHELKGDFALALADVEEILEIRKKRLGPVHEDVADGHNHLAILLHHLGDFKGCGEQLRCTIQIYEDLGIKNSYSLACTLNNLGNVYQEMGDIQSSLDLNMQALEMFKRVRGPEHPIIGGCYLNLSSLWAEKGEMSKALDFLEKGLMIREKQLGPDHTKTAELQSQLGCFYMKVDDYEKARDHLERALEVWLSIEETHPYALRTMVNLGYSLERLGEVDKGIEMCLGAVDRWIEKFGPLHPRVGDALDMVAFLEMRNGRFEEALARACRSAQIILQRSHQYFRMLVESQMQDFLEVERDAFSKILTLLQVVDDSERSKRLPEAFSLELRRRGRILEELTSRRLTLELVEDEEVSDLLERFHHARLELAQLYCNGPSDGSPSDHDSAYAENLEAAAEKKDDLERELNQRSDRFRRDWQWITADQEAIGQNLPEGTALVEFVRYSHYSTEGAARDDGKSPHRTAQPDSEPRDLAFVLPGDGRPLELVPLGKAEELDRLLEELVSSVGPDGPRGPAEARRYGECLARISCHVWQPIEEIIRKPRLVFIVPEGPLHLVNFAALPGGREGYLLEKGWTFHYLISARDLVHFSSARKNVEAGKGLLVVGDVDYDTPPDGMESSHSTLRGQVGRAWRPLPETAEEIETVAGCFAAEDVIRLTGDAASEMNFKSLARGRRFLHLATHGFLVEPEPGDQKLSELEIKNPLLLSGIVLAGANRNTAPLPDAPGGAPGKMDDGILTAEEVATLDLFGVDCAVLSACLSGRGTIHQGEGVLGLRLAFRLAGVATVVSSLTRVGDEDTRLWMSHFYRARLEGVSVVKAAHRASRQRLREIRAEMGSDSYTPRWIPFLTAGDWR